MSISPQWILAIVGAIMLGLALKDLARHRKITPAVKSRLLVALVFAAVLAWLLLQQK
jgi:hypothetical protein